MEQRPGGFGNGFGGGFDFEQAARAIGEQFRAATRDKTTFDKGDFDVLARAIKDQVEAFRTQVGRGKGGDGPRWGGPGRGRLGTPGRGFGPGGGRGGRGKGGDVPSADDAAGWFAGRLPDSWFTEPVEVSVDRDEIVVVGRIPAPDLADGASDAERAAAESGRISRFREDTRAERIAIAQQAEHRYQRKVAWGVVSGGTRELFSVANVPVMTRLQQPERLVLDTLVDGGVARSRSEALAWCVRLVGDNVGDWLDELRDALGAVDQVRNAGPTVARPADDGPENGAETRAETRTDDTPEG